MTGVTQQYILGSCLDNLTTDQYDYFFSGTPCYEDLEAFGVSVQIKQGEIETLRGHLKQGVAPMVFVATQELSYWNEATNHAVVNHVSDPHSRSIVV